jgi:hypothetical protein
MPGYLVRRLRWSVPDHGSKWHHRIPGETPVASFADRHEAQADLERREREARQGDNPFAYGGAALCYQSSFDPPRFRDWLLDAGLDPPEPDQGGGTDWLAWWDETAPRMTDVQRARVWEGLDRVRFFDLVEQPRRTGFVVVEVNFEYNDEYNAADTEGGAVTKVFLRRELAEAHLRRLGGIVGEDGEGAEEEDDGYDSYRRDGRAVPVSLTDPVGLLPYGRHHEIIEVELED